MMEPISIYEQNLAQCGANYEPLSPVDFLVRSAATYPDRPAVVYGDLNLSYADLYARSCRLASALVKRGIKKGDTVAVMLPNIPPMVEAHYGIPMMGAILNTLNIRLDAETIAFMLGHGEARALITDTEFVPIIREALGQMDRKIMVIDVRDPLGAFGDGFGALDYGDLLAEGSADFPIVRPKNEWQAISLNYTSGTTGNPKGVVYHHRGAYLNAVNNGVSWNIPSFPVYLWTLPMFHCNGWCFPWTVTLYAGTHVCLRRVEARAVYESISRHGVTHMCGAPIVMNMLINSKPEERHPLPHRVKLMTAAAPPPPRVIEAMEQQGFDVTHVYGLTETYGPAAVCAWKPEWDALPMEERARLKARQGVRYPLQADLMVADPETLVPVAQNGEAMGEVFMRGNITMKGYLKNPTATYEAFKGDWFHTGDLGVWHPDGYIELKDRSKDIIISGGENISTIEVEGALYRHPAVLEAAVVARPDTKWGETPCAFITLKEGHAPSEEDIIQFCRNHLAYFKIPRTVVFCALPKTSTGKVQKYVLRDRAREL